MTKNAGYNYEIAPGQSVSFGYTLSGENLIPPEKFEIVSKRADVTEGYEVQFDIYDDWGDGFQGAVTVTNTGSEPLEAWTLKFDTNFVIDNYWGGRIIESSENSYTIASEMWTNPIMPNSSSSFGFTAKKLADAEAAANNFVLTSVRIDENTITEEAKIIAEAVYDTENKKINIAWNSTVPTGIFEVMTSLDGVNFEIAAAVENVASYEYAIDGGFGVAYIKICQNIGGNIVESNIVTVAENAEDIDYELDTDEDGLPDYYEDILGTDKNNTDTDGDGLSDGYEVLYLGTDPLKADSDDNGINDGDEDLDSDGLTNLQESNLGTDSNNADTDGDGLTDGAEVNTHGTDPLKYDTDGDGISDGDEIALGLNPNSATTDGTPDGERTFTQVVSSDSEVLSAVNDDEETPFKVSLEMKSAGVAENNVYARESGYSNAIENSAIIGIAPEFVYTDGLAVEEVTVKFELDNSIINNTLGTYAAENDGFDGIKRLTVFMFFDDINMLLPVETNYDEVNNVVYTTTDRVGTYCLMDMEIFFQNLGIESSKSAESEVSEAMLQNSLDIDTMSSYNINSARTVNINNTNFEDKNNFDVAFVVGEVCYNETQLETICNEIYAISEFIFQYSKGVTISVYGLDGTGNTQSTWYGSTDNLETIKYMLGNIKHKEINNIDNMVVVSDCVDYVTLAHMNTDSEERRNREEYCFMFFDPEYKIKDTRLKNGEKDAFTYLARTTRTDEYGIKLLEIINRDGTDINFSTVTGAFQTIENQEKSYAKLLSYDTGGINIDNISYENVVSECIEHIYGKKPANAYKAIIATGYQTVVLDKPLTERDMEYAKILLNDPNNLFTNDELRGCADTDGDELYDFQEVAFWGIESYNDYFDKTEYCELIEFNNGKIKLPTVSSLISTYGINGRLYFVEKGIPYFEDQYADCWNEFFTYPILPIKSDPTNINGDLDGIPDKLDGTPLYDSKIPELFENLIAHELVEYDSISLVDDELIICCTSYSEILSSNKSKFANIMQGYGISDEEYESIVALTTDTYIIADRIIDSSYYTVLKIEDLDRLSYDFSSVYDIKMICRNEQIDFNRLRQESNEYTFFYDLRKNAEEAVENINELSESISSYLGECATPNWLQILNEFVNKKLPNTKAQSVVVTIHDGVESFNKGVFKGGIMVISFCPTIAAYSCTVTVNALDYDYLYRKAYREKYGTEPSFLCSLYPGIKASAETYGNLGSLMLNGVFDSFVTEDGKFNINGTIELLGMVFGGAVTSSLGSVDLEVVKAQMEGKIVPAGLKNDIANIDSAYGKVFDKGKTPVDVFNAERITYDSPSKETVVDKLHGKTGKDIIKNIKQVEYNSTDLSQKAFEYRKNNGFTASDRNVAVCEYIDNSGEICYTYGYSIKGSYHSEEIIINTLEREGIPIENIKRIYTEREPCVYTSTNDSKACADLLNKKCPNAEITYTFEYGLTSASGRAAQVALKEILKELLNGGD